MEISWGDNSLSLNIPDNNLAQLIKPRTLEANDDVWGTINRALENPYGDRLEDLAKGKTVTVLIEDGTRKEPHQVIVESLSARLKEAKKVRFMITTGSHDIDNPENAKIKKYIKESIEKYELPSEGIFINDCFNDKFRNMGKTSIGTEVWANEKLLDANLFVVGADMKHHYFAGYSNALKDFLPGICSFRTIEMNHSLALDPRSTFAHHPFHPDPERRDNPLANDMLEAMKLIVKDADIFVLGTIVSGDKIVWSASGNIEKVTAEGIAKVDNIASFSVEPAKYLVVSPGGYPQDESLYNSQRGLELTKNAVLDGGEILLLAECKNGIAPNEEAKKFFYDELTKPLDEVLESIKGEYHLYTHKAYKFAELLKRVERIWFYSGLSDETVEKAHLSPTNNPQRVIDGWIQKDPPAKILAFDVANKLAVVRNGKH